MQRNRKDPAQKVRARQLWSGRRFRTPGDEGAARRNVKGSGVIELKANAAGNATAANTNVLVYPLIAKILSDPADRLGGYSNGPIDSFASNCRELGKRELRAKYAAEQRMRREGGLAQCDTVWEGRI